MVRTPLTVGSLFAGIGGFDRGLEMTGGFETVWQVENDKECIEVLERHNPNVRRWGDVRSFPPCFCDKCRSLWEVDLICGGFPCQDISASNYRGRGLDGSRSGLWFEFARIIRTLRPKYVIAENVPAITFRGLDRILCDLAAGGYDAEWNTLSARMFGAPQQRNRLFLVAYPVGKRCETDGILTRCAPQTTSEEQAARLRLWPGKRKSGVALPDRIRWCPDSELCRVVNGAPDKLDRYRMLGNAVVPQVARWIGERILEAEHNGTDTTTL